MWIEIVLFLFLAVCAVYDGFSRRVPLAVVWIGMLTAVCLQIGGAMGETNIVLAALSLLPGAGFFLLSFLTREKVGYGDGWTLLMIGLFVGAYRCFLILLVGLMAESVAAVVLLVIGKIKRDREIPFLPFLLLGMGVVVCF